VDVRINVIGASGSGTSTLGQSLALALDVPFFESDDFYHAPTDPPFQRQRPAEERYELLCRDLKPEASWVLGGGVVGWVPCPVLRFTAVVFLYVPTEIRVERLRLRERRRFGNRIDEGGDMHGMHESFIDWASRYDIGDIEGKTLARHEAFLKGLQCQVLEYRGVGSVSEITASVLQSLGKNRVASGPEGATGAAADPVAAARGRVR
jgi:shikimate kinase